MSEEDKHFFEKFILNNPFDFKQGIINHCRELDKLDVYEWVAEDELKINKLQQEIQELKKKTERMQSGIDSIDAVTYYVNDNLYKYIAELENQQKEFIEYLENEKDRLARECSSIYEYSLGKTRLVNEDIFNEVDKNLAKYKEIIGGK